MPLRARRDIAAQAPTRRDRGGSLKLAASVRLWRKAARWPCERRPRDQPEDTRGHRPGMDHSEKTGAVTDAGAAFLLLQSPTQTVSVPHARLKRPAPWQ